MVALFAWHVKVYNFVLVGIIDVVSRLDVQLRGLFVFHHCAESLRDSIQERGLAYTRVADDSDFEPEVVVVYFASW